MLRTLILFVTFLLAIHISYAQEDSEELLSPILLDKSALSGVDLKKIELKDEPEKDFFQRQLYRGVDISVYVVSTESWNNSFTDFWFDEFVYMFHGEAVVKPQSGRTQLFHTGDFFFAPKGFTGEWEIRAGENLHYELSVITTFRADSALISESLNHILFDKSKLSGVSIATDENGLYEEILQAGVELTIKLMGEEPRESEVITPEKEKLIHVLSGQLTLKDEGDNVQTFFTGDFFVLPKGFTGVWKSEGHGLVKYLVVEKTEH